MNKHQFKFDGAISFLKQDEALAVQIRDALKPLDFFVYSKSQEDIAGTDGIETFREVFRNSARVSLVLFRSGWAKTPWTRVEETAIKDHCLEFGWDHLMFVRLDKEGDKPKWVPDSYIYLDFKSFTLADLVGATKAKCAKLGVELQPPKAIDKARQIAERQRFDKETSDLMHRSPDPFDEAAGPLFDALDESFKELGNGTGWKLVSGRDRDTYVARLGKISLQLYPQQLYGNTCHGSYLAVHIVLGAILTPQERGAIVWGEPTPISNTRLYLARTPEHGWCWSENDAPLSIQDAAASLVERVIEAQEQK
jgi:hypothetical protein